MPSTLTRIGGSAASLRSVECDRAADAAGFSQLGPAKPDPTWSRGNAGAFTLELPSFASLTHRVVTQLASGAESVVVR